MGSYMSCLSSDTPQATTYDMTPVKNKNLPFIWMTGPPNSGKTTIGRLIRNKYKFEFICITDLLRQESNGDSKRAVVTKRHLSLNKKVPDVIVMDLLKEALLDSTNDKGFLISNFPKTSKQAEMFTKDIGDVNFVFYLYTGYPLLIDRAQRKSAIPLDNDVVRRNIATATREIKACLGKFAVKIESINTSGLPEETLPKVETALIRRINIARPIVAETDYIQVQPSQQSGQLASTSPNVPTHAQVEAKQKRSEDDNTTEEEKIQIVAEIMKHESMQDFQGVHDASKGNNENDLTNNSNSKHEDNKTDTAEDLENDEKEINLIELNQEGRLTEENIVSLNRN